MESRVQEGVSCRLARMRCTACGEHKQKDVLLGRTDPLTNLRFLRIRKEGLAWE